MNRSGLTIVLLSNNKASYNCKSFAYRCKNNCDVRFANENNFDKFRGLDVDAIICVGECNPENVVKFQTLIRE